MSITTTDGDGDISSTRSRDDDVRALRRLLIFTVGIAIGALVGMALVFALAGCTASYENENGPRGPETIRFGTAYPRPLAPCCAPPAAEKQP